ncbi:transcriptional regulator [Enterobacteriaceae bacterium BIT-l23]|uniref:winged helix-turn-helix domain-containing protein n=1 Tax=Jejubacter sp. L23 TaxID=3092086 RepID=UPI0015846450|nr:transcriptional regulator [Enterobacteriaceae bacterium BIT-l23]
MNGLKLNEGKTFLLDKNVMFLPSKRRLVSEDNRVVELTENNYRFLSLLLTGETDKQAIIDFVWQEQNGSVSESSYYGQLYLLRKALTACGLAESLIKTIPRKGVRYTGTVKEVSIDSNTTSEKEVSETLSGALEAESGQEELHGKAEVEVRPTPVQRGSAEWYQSRSWNVFVSVLAVIAVCWITTLIFVFLFLLK